MADATVIPVDPPLLPTTDYDSGLSVPPFDTAFFSQADTQNDAVIDDLDFDFSFDDLYLPSPDELDDLLNPTQIQDFGFQFGQDVGFHQFAPNVDQSRAVSNSNSSELPPISGDVNSSGDLSSDGFGVLNSALLGLDSQHISGYLNVTSPESNGSNRGSSENCSGDAKVPNWPSPESRGSGNCGSNVSEGSNNCVTRSVSSSPNLNSKSIREVVNQKVNLEEPSKRKVNSSLLKRKKDSEDLSNNAVESNKCKYSNFNPENSNNNDGLSEEDGKKKTRLMRNRESAQLSRQRRKHYVGELEEKVRTMHSTIQDLNVKISYCMAENATLRQQMGGGGAVPPPPMAPPPHGMYPHPAMMYPWMPWTPPYMTKQGSQVPLVPIPRLRSQQPLEAPKASKKAENKKNEGPKTKKVASVSFLGLLFFIMLFGGLVPMVNVRYGGVRETLTGGESYVGAGFYEKHHGRVLMVNGTVHGDRKDFSSKNSAHCDKRGHDSGGKQNPDEFVRSCNGSEPLVASLYVPRNDKLIKIDGNLIIHSVLASEKAISSHGKGGGDTGLVVPGDLGPSIPLSGVRIDGRHPDLKALGPGSADAKNPNATDGRLQQWFREGLAGPMLSSGMCTEVFQFDLSAASTSGAIVPAPTTTRNISEEQIHNSTHLSKSRNRRILHGLPIPLPESPHDISRRHTGRNNSQKENLNTNNTVSPMVVSVLVDPREVGDADVDGVMGAKPISRIFVVVLIDSVKYVTYSCMLPFKGSSHQLVTA